MLKDITIGQYFPKNSAIHSLDPRTKILLTILYMAMVFSVDNIICYLFISILTIFFYFISKIPIKLMLKSIKPILPLMIFTSIINLFFVSGSSVFTFYFINITKEGIEITAVMLIRLICLIAGSSLLTYTSSPIELTDGIESILNPLKKIKFPAHEISMMMTIALRFIPTLIEETEKITIAQKSRGADLESGGIFQRIKAIIPILIPLFVSAFKRAEELATAMECRCYNGGIGRTRMKKLSFKPSDLISVLIMLALLTAMIFINLSFPVKIF